MRGKKVTPYLLKKIVALTSGRSLQANIKLALNNVKLGAQIAKALKPQD
ncbi:MAG: pseudouridine-5'-phosphate glycosidase [Candidatus Marinimicrobia bacterium]|nr:pseudouridine-5'-phosphate glycosidase [Candidatus Neomarinimicrobiota bacterium]